VPLANTTFPESRETIGNPSREKPEGTHSTPEPANPLRAPVTLNDHVQLRGTCRWVKAGAR
jgi:hypothetical protein